jgi:hypothetical protein
MTGNRRPCWILDMDGTLADVSGIRHHVTAVPRDFYAFHSASVDVPPHAEVVKLARSVHARGVGVVVVTAREAIWRHHTAWWLAMWDVPSDALFMRAVGDYRPDVEVKRDILTVIRASWTVVHAVDDNPAVIALWESAGVSVTRIPGWPDDAAETPTGTPD